MLINGQGFSFSSIRMSLLGNFNVAGIKGISYAKNKEKSNSLGVGGEPVERVRGNTTYEGSISLTLKEVKNIRKAAGNLSLVDIPPFAITLSYANDVDPVTTDIIEFVEFTSDPTTANQGDQEITVELPIVIGNIIYNQ